MHVVCCSVAGASWTLDRVGGVGGVGWGRVRGRRLAGVGSPEC